MQQNYGEISTNSIMRNKKKSNSKPQANNYPKARV